MSYKKLHHLITSLQICTHPSSLQVCKFAITHIGDNMPCTEPPGPVVTGYENTVLKYGDGTADSENACGMPAEFEFKVWTRRRKESH